MRSAGLPLGGGSEADARSAWLGPHLISPWMLLIERMEEGWQGLTTIMPDVPKSGSFRSLISPEMETAWKCLFSTPRLCNL